MKSTTWRNAHGWEGLSEEQIMEDVATGIHVPNRRERRARRRATKSKRGTQS